MMLTEAHLTGGPWDGRTLLINPGQRRVVIPGAEHPAQRDYARNVTYLPRRVDGRIVEATPRLRHSDSAQVFDYAPDEETT